MSNTTNPRAVNESMADRPFGYPRLNENGELEGPINLDTVGDTDVLADGELSTHGGQLVIGNGDATGHRLLGLPQPTIAPLGGFGFEFVSKKAPGSIVVYISSDTGFELSLWDGTEISVAAGSSVPATIPYPSTGNWSGRTVKRVTGTPTGYDGVITFIRFAGINCPLTRLEFNNCSSLEYIQSNLSNRLGDGTDAWQLLSHIVGLENCPLLNRIIFSVSGITKIPVLHPDVAFNSLRLTGFSTQAGRLRDVSALKGLKRKAIGDLQLQNNQIEGHLDVSNYYSPSVTNGTLYVNDNNLSSIDLSCDVATSLLFVRVQNNPALTSIRAENVALSSGHYYSSSHKVGSFLDNCNLSAEALNQFFTDLAPSSGYLFISGNPGTDTCDSTIATAKGYTVRTT